MGAALDHGRSYAEKDTTAGMQEVERSRKPESRTCENGADHGWLYAREHMDA